MQNTEKATPDETVKDKLHDYIDSMDDYQARLVQSFIKTLFNLTD